MDELDAILCLFYSRGLLLRYGYDMIVYLVYELITATINLDTYD